MSIKGIGVDLEKISRFKKLPYQRNRAFYEKVFTDREIKYCLSKDDPYPHFAARFAGKEAVLKTMGSTVYKIKNVEIVNNKNGLPLVRVKDRQRRGKFLISLSHTSEWAIAFAIWLN